MLPYFDTFSFAVVAILEAPNDSKLQPCELLSEQIIKWSQATAGLFRPGLFTLTLANDETVVSKISWDWLFGIGSLW